MAEYNKHLYMIVYPINALVASQLEPDQFGEHYTIGGAKHYSGKVIFAELDPNYRNESFEIEKYLDMTVTHEDGSPKKTKFIKSYGVLADIDIASIQKLHLCTSNGKVLTLEPSEYTAVNEPGLIRTYQEITPLENLVVSSLDQRDFGKYITTQTQSKGAPKICFTQVEFNIDHFLKTNKHSEIFNIELPRVNPYRMYDCIKVLQRMPDKATKTVGLGSLLRDLSFSYLRHGFWFFGPNDSKFFAMPSISDLENKYYGWWKHVR
ncbi:MAG: hypothetical protein L3J41_07375 [Melioribacteraceae bacterium]|nr:hypothetical protein [Melioribacteraceae bacterium]